MGYLPAISGAENGQTNSPILNLISLYPLSQLSYYTLMLSLIRLLMGLTLSYGHCFSLWLVSVTNFLTMSSLR